MYCHLSAQKMLVPFLLLKIWSNKTSDVCQCKLR